MEKTILSPTTTLQGRYRIIQLLGHGGMGAVYQAMDENLQCLVTVKETFATYAEREVRKAFEHEARLLANLRHPSLPKVTDFFERGDDLFFVMDFIHGDDLAKIQELRGGPLPVGDVLRWADILLDALAELHSFSPPIVHRDIKPSNIKRTLKGELFLLDFGLAKGAAGQMPTLHSKDYSHIHGHTPHFAPPEQIFRSGTSPRSDLYSLAATLWSLLAGAPPPDAMIRSEAVNYGRDDPLRPINELNPSVSPAVAAVIHQALSLNSTRRPEGAKEMRAALREAVEAPRRAEAERERREAEEHTRREGEEAGRLAAEAELTRRLEAERDAHADALRQLTEQHEEALAKAREELAQTRSKLLRAMEEAAAGQSALEAARAGLREEKIRTAKEMAAKLNAEKERARFEAQWRRLEAESRENGRTSKQTETEMRSYIETLRTELDEARGRHLKAEHSLKQTEDALKQTAAVLANKDTALREAVEVNRRLTKEHDKARTGVKESEDRLGEKLQELHRVKRQQDDALASVRRGRRKMGFVGFLTGAFAAATLALFIAAMRPSALSPSAPTPEKEVKPTTLSEYKVKLNDAGVYLDMVEVPGGAFMMGSPDTENGRNSNEGPQHRVTVPAFRIGKYEVTQAQWRVVARLPKVEVDLPEDPSKFKGNDLPIDNVDWHQAVEFCARLSRATGQEYRLPTEAEWEYATRAGTTGAFAVDDPSASAWYADNSGKQPFDSAAFRRAEPDLDKYLKKMDEIGQSHTVGSKQANAFGLHDTLGNVYEWCLDIWHYNYDGAPGDGSAWMSGGEASRRITRGCSWASLLDKCRSAYRGHLSPDTRFSNLGFRVVSPVRN